MCWNVFPTDPKTTSLENGEWNCLSVVGHDIGDEMYKCVSWNEFMRFPRMPFGNVYCESLRGSFWEFCIYIFGIAMPLLFQMVA